MTEQTKPYIYSSCSTCAYYRINPLRPALSDFYGDCRRFPPVKGEEKHEGEFFGASIMTDCDDWCGEYKQNEFFVRPVEWLTENQLSIRSSLQYTSPKTPLKQGAEHEDDTIEASD